MQKILTFKKAIAEKNLDAALAITNPNVTYFTGQRDLNSAILIPLGHKPIIFTNTLEKIRARLSGFQCFSIGKENCDIKTKSFFEGVAKFCRDEKIKIKKLGLEKSSLTTEQVFKIKKFLKPKISDISKILAEQRTIKSREEIIFLRRAAQIADAAQKAVRENLRAGMNERELAAIAEFEMRKKGADWFSFETIVGSGPNGAMPHHTVSNRKISATDLVVVDLGCIYKNYCSDTTRTLCLKPTEKQKKIYSVVMHAQQAAIEKISQEKASELDKASRNTIENFGYKFIHSTGHGLGIEIHELPNLKKDSKDLLKPGTVFTIEPGIYIKGFGGVRIEDMFLKTKNGFEDLTKADRQLKV